MSFDARKSLIRFSQDENDAWTVDDAMKGISIMGGTGSGKTTASGKALALKFLKEGWGGIVLCAKTDEADNWEEYCKEAGRELDLIRFTKGSPIVFNAIDYEMKRAGKGAGETQNITNIFMNIFRMGNRIAQEGDTKEERFWDTALKRCLNRIIDLIKIAGEDLSYRNMVKILSTSNDVDVADIGKAVVESEKGGLDQYKEEKDFCLYCLVKAYFNVKDLEAGDEKSNAYDMAVDYFTHSFKSMGKRTRSVVIESFMGLAEPFLSGLLREHFSGVTNITPELTYTEQRIILLDFPIKEFLDAGIIAQSVFKLMFQQSIERRDVRLYPTPVFLWADEAQYFINPYDQIFLTTARSSRTSTVYLSQNISNYMAVMGSGSDAKARVDSLMGNLSTKVFHANSDAETNEYASRLIGMEIINLAGASVNRDVYLGVATAKSEQISSQYLPQVQPKAFTTLRSGGPLNNYKVDSIITVSGRKWASGRNFIPTTFTQSFAKINQT